MKRLAIAVSVALVLAGTIPAQIPAAAGGTPASVPVMSPAGTQGADALDDAAYALDAVLATPEGRASVAMATADYPVTPGDVYSVTFLTSGGQVVLEAPIGPDYRFALPNLPPLEARNLTFVQLRDAAERAVLRAYPGSSPRVVVKTVGAFQVFVRGEVAHSGVRLVWGLTRLSELWANVTPWASRRAVRIVSADGTSRTFDLYLADRDGDLAQNPYVKPFDTVEFLRCERQVALSGAVRRPGSYQLLAGDTLGTLIERYGDGLVETADPARLSLVRRVGAPTALGETLTLDFPSSKDFVLNHLDSVHVPSITALLPAFFFEGAVGVGETGDEPLGTRRMAFTLVPGLSLSRATQDLRERFSSVSDLPNAFLSRGGLTYPVDLSRFLYDKDYSGDMALEPGDVVVVPFRQFFVSVSGAVALPGRYPYIPERGWEYYVNLAGGVDRERNSGDALDIVSKEGTRRSKDSVIEPEDSIVVRSNSALYSFGRISGIVGVMISVGSLVLGIIQFTR
ncbi:MAG: SLBB domain-containing protein [Spirochaetales bacterium]|nr:SLBB domain-containing protein [Spirochaetales bacterium]